MIKNTIKEVISATELHRQVIQNNIQHGARIGKATLKDMALGMDISITKLELILKEIEGVKRSLKYCTDHARPSVVQDVAREGLWII
jgi:hypothetical protein